MIVKQKFATKPTLFLILINFGSYTFSCCTYQTLFFFKYSNTIYHS